MTPEMLAFSYPMGAVVHFRYGFLLRRTHDVKLFNPYYTRPFTARLWKFLTAAAVVVCCLFYLGAWWEKRLLGDHVECSLGLEVLLIIGGYCQHIFPVDVVFSSRRTAYFTFFLYSYIIYTVYTSNLLSHLVSEKENVIRIEDLESGSFDFAIFGNMRHILEYDYTLNKNTPFSKKLSQAKALPIKQALNALRFNRTALLSDYMSLFPAVRADFTDTEICELIEIDLNDDVRKYIFTSKEFKYKEELKISTLKAIETGVLKRYTSYDDYHPLKCETVLHQEVRIEHVCLPLIALVAVFGISFIIMILEILFYEYTKVWPFVN
ncbi:uncharacterized protein LOC114364651 [Ostrinia furnacalis]|uniref:uncharacterized protein LOC114364651 n=1 Tax=Ostrinia furnacalis TaxID=93504 RepID=UPI0010393756|nr:uncharacterized protein LOC114364651 [Ostrinia furnacalis]